MPNYLAKVIKLDGTVIADPLPAQAIRFTRVLSFPGERNLGGFRISLIPPRGINAHYLLVYEQLDYMQRVEIYEDQIAGDPVFAGYIIDMSADLGAWQISGDEWLGILSLRRMAHYQPLEGVITSLMSYVLDTWDSSHFYDDFTAGSIDPAWTQNLGTWGLTTVNNRQWLTTTGGGPVWQITTPLALNSNQEDYFKVRVEMQALTQALGWGLGIIVFFGHGFNWYLTITHTATEDRTHFELGQGGTKFFERYAGKYEVPFEERFSIEMWVYDGGLGQVCEVWLNGRQFMIGDSSNFGTGGTLSLSATQVDSLVDNVIIFTREGHMAKAITTATPSLDTDDFESPQDPYLKVLTFLADQIDYQWKVNAKAGAGNDLITLASAVGTDKSGVVRFVEGGNLISLQLNPSGKNLTTWYRFSGQGSDVNMMLAEAYDKTAIELYGIIENQISDSRISTVHLAQQKVENELVRAKDGSASLSATVYYNRAYDDYDIGDTVWVQTTSPDLAQAVLIVAIDYESGSNVRSVTFDKFPRSRSGMIGMLTEDVETINRWKSINAAETILTYRSETRIIDDYGSELVYEDTSSGTTSAFGPLTDPIWHKFTGGVAHPAFGQTLHFTSDHGCTCAFDMKATGFSIYSVKSANLSLMDVHVDNLVTPYTTVDANGPNIPPAPGDFRYLLLDIPGGTLTPSVHSILLKKSASLPANANIYIAIDRIVKNSGLWSDIFLEGRAVNSAKLSFINSNKINPVPLRVYINNVDRTVDIGGPPSGFVGDQTDLDVSEFISNPGAHSIDFVYMAGYDTRIDATLAVQLFV